MGVDYIEASADTDLDPLYMGEEYFSEWTDLVREAEKKHAVKVCNLYSGHGTYTTLGLTHPDKRVREHMIENWFSPMVRTAGELGCGMGFYAHGFENAVLQSDESYWENVDILVGALSKINRYAGETGCGKLGVEQMYSPHHYPWRIKDVKELISRVTQESGRDFYFTEDVGHHHVKFIRRDKETLRENGPCGTWLGTDKAYELANEFGIDAWDSIEAEMDRSGHLFSEPKDGDCYEILRQLGCYSPIIHLQQTNGTSSAHLPFTDEENAKGIIRGPQILQAIKESYESEPDGDMPARTDEIYLTLEVFSYSTSILNNVLCDYRKSVDYWRQYIPEDGLRLDDLCSRI